MHSFVFILLFPLISHAGTQHHLIYKTDLNKDGVADRVVYASNGISGFYQSTYGNGEIDVFSITQGNKEIYYSNLNKKRGPFVKVVENFGLFKISQLYIKRKANLELDKGIINPSTVYFKIRRSFSNIKTPICNDNNISIKNTNEVDKIIEVLNLKESNEKCLSLFGEEQLAKMNIQLTLESKLFVKNEANEMISCLDNHPIGAEYKKILLQNIFSDGFKISCEIGKTNDVSALYNSGSNEFIFYKLENPIFDFSELFRHEMLHKSNSSLKESEVDDIISKCKTNTDEKIKFANDLRFADLSEEEKNGVEITLPNYQIPQSNIDNVIKVASNSLNKDYSTDNEREFISLSQISKRTFNSFSPVMNAAFKAAVPVAFAGNKIKNESESSTKSVEKSQEIKVVKSDIDFNKLDQAPSRMPAAIDQGILISKPTLPESADTRSGSLGNGMVVKAEPVKFDIKPSSSHSKATSQYLNQIDNQMKQPEMIKASLGVPSLVAENNFLKMITQGNYKDVKSKLSQPETHKMLEKFRVQYVEPKGSFGSNDPYLILKDLGNGFEIRRVTIE